MSETSAKLMTDITSVADLETVGRVDRKGSLDDLYRRHAADIRATLLKTFGAGPPEPDDVVHEAFAKYASLDDPARVNNPRAFLYTTARNIVLDHKRRQKRVEAYVAQALHEAAALKLEGITSERVIIEKERFKIMVGAMKKLPRKQRVVLTMNRLHGKSYAEISRLTGWSAGDISRQMNAGLEAISEALDGKAKPSKRK